MKTNWKTWFLQVTYINFEIFKKKILILILKLGLRRFCSIEVVIILSVNQHKITSNIFLFNIPHRIWLEWYSISSSLFKRICDWRCFGCRLSIVRVPPPVIIGRAVRRRLVTHCADYTAEIHWYRTEGILEAILNWKAVSVLVVWCNCSYGSLFWIYVFFRYPNSTWLFCAYAIILTFLNWFRWFLVDFC